MTCPNCSTESNGNFCPECGQALWKTRITWKYFFAELQQRIFGFDNKFARTIKDLTIRPEKVINDVINGIQVRYFGPLGYYFILITIYVLLISILEIDMAKLSEAMNFSPADTTEEQAALQTQMGNTIFEYFRLFSLLMLPFFILGNYIIFKNKKFNYLENGVIVLYAMGHPMVLSIILLITFKFTEFTFGFILVMLISYLYYCWVCMRFYPGNKIWNFFKGIFSLILSYVFLMAFTIIGSFIYFSIFPEAAKKFVQ